MQNERGLTLIEIIAAIAILSIVILSFTQLSSSHRLSDLQSERINEANRIIEQIINEIRSEYTSNSDLPSLISTKQNKYNAIYSSKYRFQIQYSAAASSITFANQCTPTEMLTSIPITLFNNSTSYLISITACWSK